MRPFWFSLFLTSTALAAAPVDFVREVKPLFERYCYECHGSQKQKNDYRLDVKHAAFTGGDEHAPNIVAGKGAKSPLLRFVSGLDKDVRMPPKGKKLTDAEIALLRRWIDEGAVWPESADTVKLEDRTDWWSLKPVEKKMPQGQAGSASSVIDAFIGAKLQELHFTPSPEADARTLIRRLYFDLVGLPPEPEAVEQFVKQCQASKEIAYEALVDRLLASPRYGERWARHWLDVVHYGETHGYDKDKPRNNAWPYRDYVIRALNADKPYTRFVQEQIAGDVLYPGTTDGITALGMISAGPWDLIGHTEVPESKTDGKIARHLDRDDMVQNTFGNLCSLTVQCAQCHNHKFDAITQEDYYSLQAVFAAVDRTDVKYYADDGQMKEFHDLQVRRKAVATALAAVEEPLKRKAGAAYEELTRRIDGASAKATQKQPNVRPDYGYHSAISPVQDAVKWVQVDLGQQVEIQRVALRPCYDNFNAIGAGFGFPLRFKIEASDDPEFKKGVTLFWRRHDETFMHDFRNPGLQAFIVNGAGDDDIKGRYVRVTAVKLAPRQNDYIFALAELEVFDKAGKNLAVAKPISAADSIEAAPRWRKANLTDGIAPEAPSKDEKDTLIQQREALLLGQADVAAKNMLTRWRQEMRTVEEELKKLPAPQAVYAGAVHTGSGAFRGTGNDGGKPRAIHVLRRGDVKTPDKEVGPAAIRAVSKLSGLAENFAKTDDEATRRAALAEWITDARNPLTWRSIVNRVWQYHFGRGFVDTPNDFGRMGTPPTHPELLDWLAVTFRDDLGGSLKKLHKLIVMTETYRQSSSDQPALSLTDADNRYLWRQNRRKLDAEAIRDSVLAVSGRLDLAMGGPSFRDFVVEKPEHSPHYEYKLHDPEDPKSWRRSIYRFIVRSQQQPFMTVLDCADPSMRVDKRNESLSPLQALAMMNNALMVTMAKHFAERVEREVTGDVEEQTRRAFSLACGRPPLPAELSEMAGYARMNGLANVCRLLLNLNEFAFVD